MGKLVIGEKMVTVDLPEFQTRLGYWEREKKFQIQLLGNGVAWLNLYIGRNDWEAVTETVVKLKRYSVAIQECNGWIDLLSEDDEIVILDGQELSIS